MKLKKKKRKEKTIEVNQTITLDNIHEQKYNCMKCGAKESSWDRGLTKLVCRKCGFIFDMKKSPLGKLWKISRILD